MNAPLGASPDLDSEVYRIGCGAPSARPALPSPQSVGIKAWNLMRMAQLGLPVPPAFVLGTRFCADGQSRARAALPLLWQPPLHELEVSTGLLFGDASRPLLVSVRSGAPVSMPGMMETLLDIGLCDATVGGLLRQTGNPRLVWDAYRRLVATHAEVVGGQSASHFDAATSALFGNRDERDLDFAELRDLTNRFLEVYAQVVGNPFPQDPHVQLSTAIAAVLGSWQSEKARAYRSLNRIPDAIGTAVTVQQMVFGDAGGRSGAGVGFTRNPTTGEPGLWVDFLFNAQGEDVVSGRRNAQGDDELAAVLPAVWKTLVDACNRLESAFLDMQDVEFTVQDGQLFLLQSRAGKRTPLAAARIALDMLDEKLISSDQARERTAGLDQLSLAQTRLIGSGGAVLKPLASAGIASSGVAVGEIALDEARASSRHKAGVAVILVRRDAQTSDIAALAAAVGLLTQHGARTSHAAVVARQLGKVCLIGCAELNIDDAARTITIGKTTLREGDMLTLDGNTGRIYAGTAQSEVFYPEELLTRLAALRQGAGVIATARSEK